MLIETSLSIIDSAAYTGKSRVSVLRPAFHRMPSWGRVVNALLSVYDRLPEEIRPELPLRRTWTLVPEDEE